MLWDRHIHSVAFAKPGPHVLQVSGAWIERGGAMDIEKENTGIGPENILGAVAVVGIPIDNQDTLTAQLRLGMSCRNIDIIEQAKSSRPDGLGMMARRSHQGKGALTLTTASTAAMALPAAEVAALMLSGDTAVVS